MMAALLLTSCSESSLNAPGADPSSSLSFQSHSKTITNYQLRDKLQLGSIESLQDINVKLAGQGLNIRLSYAETVTRKEDAQAATGQTIYANDRQKRLASQWVPGDERRMADDNNLTYLVYGPYAPANYGTSNQIDSEPAIDASFATWNNIKKNAKLDILKRPDTGEFPSAIFAGGNPFLADITEFGFLPGLYFDLVLGPGSSDTVLGVTFTFNFVDEAGNPTDINNDGYADTALKEVWYNDDFLWKIEATAAGTDIETVALHENGHALGFGHFGKISITGSNNKVHVSPRSVMNAIILGIQRDLLGTDQASYTNIYGSWPKN